MTDLEALKDAIRHLSPEQYQEIKAFIIQSDTEDFEDEQEVIPPLEEDVETRIAMLDAAMAEIREGLSPEDLDEIVWAMNYEYIDPESSHQYDWLNDTDEIKA